MTRGTWGTAGVAVVFALLAVTVPVIAGASGGGASEPAVTSASEQGTVTDGRPSTAFAQATAPTENNSTVSHRNPSEVSGDSNLSDVERWLAGEMTGRLVESINVSASDRARARKLIGNDSEYARLADQYADVAGDSAPGSVDRRLGRFGVVGAVQRHFLADVQRYRQGYRRYRRAREANRSIRTRRLAHLLERRASTVNRSARLLNRSYANLSAERGEFRNVTRTIGDIRANVTATQQTVRDQTLVRTRLSVRSKQSTASFTDPAVLAGRLLTADGRPVGEQTVALRIGNRTRNVTTDATGRFEVTYRPTLAAVGTESRTVAFRPANASVYRRSNASVRFAVEQVAPTVAVSTRNRTVRYNETLAVAGNVSTGGVGVPGVPLAVTVGGVQLERARTGPNGSFDVRTRLPANVSTGSRLVRVRLPVRANGSVSGRLDGQFSGRRAGLLSGKTGSNAPGRLDGPLSGRTDGSSSSRPDAPLTGRALAPANASGRVGVAATPTELSITEVQPLDRTAFVSGRLLAADGSPLANRTVSLRVGNAVVETATTNETGGFATTVDLPDDGLDDRSSVRVVAAFSMAGNLDSSRANATVTLSSGETAALDGYLRLGVAGLLGVAVVGVVVWRVRSGGASLDGGGEGADGRVSERTTRGAHRRSPEALLGAATEALDGDEYDAAVVAAYASVRERHRRADQFDADDGPGDASRPRTHWEFVADSRTGGLSDERVADLERLVSTYERAAFAAESVAADDAVTAVEAARSFELDRAADESTVRERNGSSSRGPGDHSAG